VEPQPLLESGWSKCGVFGQQPIRHRCLLYESEGGHMARRLIAIVVVSCLRTTAVKGLLTEVREQNSEPRAPPSGLPRRMSSRWR
jgi:hypothetical protein